MRQLKIIKQVTNRDTASIDKYLQEIGHVELISTEEEVQLAQRIKLGDQKALEKLTKANLRFVVSVSKQYQNQGLSLSDLINEGNLGLIKAAQRFDETRGFKFISYAVWWVRQSILQALAENSRIVRLPLNKVGVLNKVLRTYSILEQQLGRSPEAEEIADELQLKTHEVTEILRNVGRHISVDAPLSQDEGTTMIEQMMHEDGPTPEKNLIYESLKTEIGRIISTLSTREAEVIRCYFGLAHNYPMTLEEIGERYHLTRERVRQIKEKAIRQLKHTTKSEVLRTYL